MMECYLTGNLYESMQYLYLIAEREKVDVKSIDEYDQFVNRVTNMLYVKLVNFRTLVAENLADIDCREPLYAKFLSQVKADNQIIIQSNSDMRTNMNMLQQELNLVLIEYLTRGSLPKEARFESMVLAYIGLLHVYLKWDLVIGDEEIDRLTEQLFSNLEDDDETQWGMDPRVGVVTSMAVWMNDYKQFQQMCWKEKDTVLQLGQRPGQASKPAQPAQPAQPAELTEEEKAERHARREEEKRRYRRQEGCCEYCGGQFKGLFKKVCSSCGRPKSY